MTDENNVLTFEKLQQAWDKLWPPLYYQTTPWLDKDAMYYCKKSDFAPEFIVFHPDDEPVIRQTITARHLVPLADEPKEEQMARLRKQMEKQIRKTFDNMLYKGY